MNVEGKKDYFQCRFRIQHKSGEWLWVLCQGRITERSAEGEALRASGIIMDITKQQIDYLSLFKLKKAIEHSGEGVVITDRCGHVEYVNPAFENLSGHLAEDCVGESPSMLMIGEEGKSVQSFLDEILDNEKIWYGNTQMLNKKLGLRNHETSIAPVFSNKNKLVNYIIITHDVTNKNSLEKQLEKARKMEAIGLLASGIAHDFNNMLTPILGYSDLLLNDALKPEYKRRIKEIRKAAEHSRDLVRQLLNYSKRQKLKMIPLSPFKVIKESEDLLRSLLGDKITLSINGESEGCFINMDRGEIEQVIMNLVSNASDAIFGSGDVNVTISKTEIDDNFCRYNLDARPGEFCKITVSDTGCGMDKKTLERVFEPFFTTKGERGTGLGLAGVYGIIRQHGGFSLIDSHPGAGTAVNMWFPLLKDGKDLVKERVNETEILISKPVRGKILVVDDNQEIRSMASDILESQGHTVFMAENGLSAKTIIEDNHEIFDLIISDFDMPEMDGAQLFRYIQKNYPSTGFIIMTGHAETTRLEKAFGKAGPVKLLKKPFRLVELSEAVYNIICIKKVKEGL